MARFSLAYKEKPRRFSRLYDTSEIARDFFFGEATNQFLFSTASDRVSFLSLAAAALSNASELLDIRELAAYVVRSLGTESFGRPRVLPSVDLPELPRVALRRTWGKATHILDGQPPVEWPAVLGAAAYAIVNSNRKYLAPPVALKILLEAALPMSKLNPATVKQSGIPAPSLTNWSMRAFRPENQQEILAEVRGAMPATPPKISGRAVVIDQPKVAFVNLSGTSCEAIAAADQAVMAGLFDGKVQSATAPVPACDVLFLYCACEPSGRIVGQALSLRDVIRESGASLAVIASEVRPELMADREFNKSLSRGNNPPVNLVITGNRNGEAFGLFFKSLFQLMWMGLPMPMAWVQLAPQGPHQRQHIPGTICVMEAGNVTFGRSRLW